MKKDKKFITKDEYLLRNFSKIRHKKWELFVITRILHNLNDSNIEYVCQQYINPIQGLVIFPCVSNLYTSPDLL